MMKTPDEIKKSLEACGSDECHGRHTDCPYEDALFCTMYLCGDARVYIQQLENHIGELTEKVAQLEAAQPRWINTSDELPAPDTRVLASAIDNDGESIVVITEYTHRLYGLGLTGWIEPWQCFSCNYNITHWMPLPEPPKEGE